MARLAWGVVGGAGGRPRPCADPGLALHPACEDALAECWCASLPRGLGGALFLLWLEIGDRAQPPSLSRGASWSCVPRGAAVGGGRALRGPASGSGRSPTGSSLLSSFPLPGWPCPPPRRPSAPLSAAVLRPHSFFLRLSLFLWDPKHSLLSIWSFHGCRGSSLTTDPYPGAHFQHEGALKGRLGMLTKLI